MFYCGAAHLATAAATCVLPVVLRCGAARLTAAACALLAVSPSGGCVLCRTVVLPASPLPPPPVVLPSGGCASCCAVVLPASPLPARHLLCCPPRRCLRATCRAALWCCPPRHRCLHAACCVAIGQLCVVPRCGAAHLAAAACALPAVSPSGGCMSCCAVVLPVSALPPPPACCLSCCLYCRRRRRLLAACRVAVGRVRVVSRCGAACLTTAACALPAVSPLGGCVSCHAVVLPTSPPPPPPAHCLSCCRWAVACRAVLWCCPHRRCRRHLRAALPPLLLPCCSLCRC